MDDSLDVTEPGTGPENGIILQALLEGLEEGVIGLDAAGRITFLNPSARRLLGLTAPEPGQCRSWRPLIHPSGTPKAFHPGDRCPIQRALETGASQPTERDTFHRSDGVRLPVEVAVKVADPGPEGAPPVLVIFRDLREEKGSDRAGTQYRSVFEASRDAVVLLDHAQRVFIDCNPAAVALFGAADKADLLNHPPDEFSPPEQPDGHPSREAAEDRIQQAFRNGTAFFEWTHQTLQGEPFPAEVLLSRVELDEGPILQGVVRDISRRKEDERALQESREQEARYRSLFEDVLDQSGVGIFILDGDFRIAWMTSPLEEFFGINREEVLGRDKRDLIRQRIKTLVEDGEELERRLLARYGDNTEAEHFECHILPGEGRPERWLEHRSRPISSGIYAGGRVEFYQDVSERKHQERQLRQSAQAFTSIQDGLLITDDAGTILQVNPAFTSITGYGSGDVLGRQLDFLGTSDAGGSFFPAFWDRAREEGAHSEEIQIRLRSGETQPAWLSVNAVTDPAGRVANFVAVLVDIAEFKRYEERLTHLAYHDALTQLPNRSLFEDRLSHALERTQRSGGGLAVVFIDLDEFKHVNDSLGHKAGDRFLQAVAERMRTTCRSADTVARVGGDEFLLCLEDITGTEQALRFAERLQRSLEEPFELAEGHIRTTCSIGISFFPGDGDTVEALIQNADAALYQAKRAGRNLVLCYTRELTERAWERLSLAQQLPKAMEEEELALHYQPQVDMRTERMLGVEALVRWNHPERGLLGPERFIPVAEELGLIPGLGEWILRAACAQARTWLDAGRDFGRLAVNVSSRQVESGDLVETVRTCLEESGLSPSRLELELTESGLMDCLESTPEAVQALHDLGVGLVVDDFGTGYSSLLYLKRLPVRRVKIDKAFVQDLTESTEAHGIIQAILALARTLNLEVVAEGVETRAQRDLLVGEGVLAGQGFLWARPGPDLPRPK